jgi:hypothetical protein
VVTALLERPPSSAPGRSSSLPAGRRRRGVRVPEAVLGVVLVVGGALGALLWHRSATATSLVTTLAIDVGRGEELTAGVLVPLEVGSVESLGLVPWTAAGELVGRRVVADLPAGTPLLPSLVLVGVPLAEGEALAGVKVGAGAYPADLAPGDLVDAVAVPTAVAPTEEPIAPLVLASAAVVHAVEPLGDADLSQVVTLRLPAEAARALGATAGPVRLVRVAG